MNRNKMEKKLLVTIFFYIFTKNKKTKNYLRT